MPNSRKSTLDKMKKLLFLTGTRADFGKLKPLILGTQARSDFRVAVFVTGMHLMKAYGSTHIEVDRAGVQNIFKYINQNEKSSMDEILASTISGVSNYLKENAVDAIVIHGDRVEALAGAIVGALNNIKVIHIEGGERSGTIDESIRHAITKFSHLHFVSSTTAQRRLIQLGEKPESVFNIGSPNIDIILSGDLPTIEDVFKRYDIIFKEYAILIFHPVTTELDILREQIVNIVDACNESGLNFVVIKPNNDHGASVIIDGFARFADTEKYRILPSMRFEYYLTLVKHALCLVGNSSSGIYEAPVFGVPTINIGSRQQDRMAYESIQNCAASKTEILSCLSSYKNRMRYPQCFHNGDGNSLQNFLKIMESLDLNKVDIQKRFIDLE